MTNGAAMPKSEVAELPRTPHRLAMKSRTGSSLGPNSEPKSDWLASCAWPPLDPPMTFPMESDQLPCLSMFKISVTPPGDEFAFPNKQPKRAGKAALSADFVPSGLSPTAPLI
jgi:hypothetical protein